jgi:outer membrane protein
MRADATAVLVAALILVRSLSLGAEGTRIVELEECIRLGFASNAGLRAEELGVRIVDAELREMQSQSLPSVALQGSYSRLSEVTPGSMTLAVPGGPVTVSFPTPLQNSTGVRVSVQQPLFTGLRIASSVRQAEALRDAGRGDLARTRLDLRFSIEEAFWNLAKARAQEQAIGQNVAQAETHLSDVKKLLDQGMATNNDVLQAQMRAEDAKIDLAGAESFREIARVRLVQLIGLPWSDDIDVPAAVAQNVQAPAEPLDELIGKALAARPEIQSSRSRVSAQEAGVDLARSGLYPSIYLTGDYTLANPNQRVFPQSDEYTGTWSVGILATADVGRYPQILAQQDRAKNRLAQARESSRGLADVVTAEVIRAYLTLNEATKRLDALRRETAQAQENDRVTQERYAQGIALPSESQDAQGMVVRARLRENGALFDSLVARAALDRAVGR